MEKDPRGLQAVARVDGKASIRTRHGVGLIGLGNEVLGDSSVAISVSLTRVVVRVAVGKACQQMVNPKERLRVKARITVMHKAQESLRNEVLLAAVPVGTMWSTTWLGRNNKSVTCLLKVERTVGRLGLSLWAVLSDTWSSIGGWKRCANCVQLRFGGSAMTRLGHLTAEV